MTYLGLSNADLFIHVICNSYSLRGNNHRYKIWEVSPPWTYARWPKHVKLCLLVVIDLYMWSFSCDYLVMNFFLLRDWLDHNKQVISKLPRLWTKHRDGNLIEKTEIHQPLDDSIFLHIAGLYAVICFSLARLTIGLLSS